MHEAELIRMAQSGDHDALVELLRSIETSVYRSAYYILGNEQDALDASQEVLIRIYRKLDTYQEKAKFSTWVQRIVSNVCMDKFRAKKETVSIDEHELIIPDRNNVEEEILLTGLSNDIQEAIGRLPKQYRMVVVLRYLEDLSYQEIAEALDLPLNTVKSYLFRARQQLQELLYDYQKGGDRLMTNEEIFELMQRDLDGDLSESEQQLLHRLIQKDTDLQLMYNRLKDVSQQLEHLPPVVPPISIVDSILPKLESAAAKPAAVKSMVNEEILPTLEVKRESSSLPESKKWKRMKVWMASLGSTAVAASLLVGMLFSGGDGKKQEVDSFQNGTDMTPAAVEQPKTPEPDAPTPPSNNPISSNSKEEEDKTKKSTKSATQTKSKRPPAKNVQKQTPPPKKTNPPQPPKKVVPPPPVMTDDQPSGWPIGLDENPDREDKEPANDKKDDDGDKQEEKDKGKNKEKKKNKDND